MNAEQIIKTMKRNNVISITFTLYPPKNGTIFITTREDGVIDMESYDFTNAEELDKIMEERLA